MHAIQPELQLLAPGPVLEAGVVFTKPWVVELVMNLAGFVPSKPLASMLTIEPSAGDGAFLKEIVRRINASCTLHGITIEKAINAVVAFEINLKTVELARKTVFSELISLGVPSKTAELLALHWIRHEDFLIAATKLQNVDFVIGNPPYIRLEEVPTDRTAVYRNTYTTMRGRADIYVAFYEAALAALKTGGVCAFICSDRWLRNDYGSNLRSLISNGYSVRYIVETHDVDAFEKAVTAYPAITVIAKEAQASAVLAKALPGIETAPRDQVASSIRNATSNSVVRASRFAEWFSGEQPWSCSSPEDLHILQDIEARFPLLESDETLTSLGIGVATGADEVFITKVRPDIEEDRLLPLAMPCDLANPSVAWSGHYLINPWNHSGLVDLVQFPRLSAYFHSHKPKLTGRHVAKNSNLGWHKTIDRVNLALFKKPKLYIADIKDKLLPSLDAGTTYPHHNVYWITSGHWDLRVLGAILMSGVGEFFIRSYGVKMRGGYFRFQAQYLRRIHVPNPKSISGKATEALRKSWETRDVQLATDVCMKLYGIKSLPKPN